MARSSLSLFLVTCFFVSCAQDSKNPAQAPLLIGESFVVDHRELTSNSETYIGIRKSSLEKEFLLQGEIIPQPKVAQFNNLKSRIVLFKLVNNTLNMLEAVDGHTSSVSIPQNILLAQFTVVKDENDIIFFDFSEGMSKIYVSEDWYASDFSGSAYNSNQAWKSLGLSANYIEEAKTDKNNNLVIRQIAQVASSRGGSQNLETTNIPVEIKYYLSPYRENPGFVPKKTSDFQQVGFFEVNPRLQSSGGQVVYASRWDERKTISYSISANTPEEYIESIKEGVLYWNKAFGKEVLKVDIAPEGIVAPDFNHNMIQWVDWNDAGYAYADAQMDPRTGEILHSSIFLTSVFAFSAKNKARQLIRRLHFEKGQASNEAAPSLGNRAQAQHFSIEGFEQQHLCQYQFSQDFSIRLMRVLDDIENGRADEETLLKISQDTIREVVAHEVGHTLGLRHNFAGTLASTVPNEKRKEVFQDYLMSGEAPHDMNPTSTVMDYQQTLDTLLTGDIIHRREEALEYDNKAIKHLYYNESLKNMPLFCTDSHVGRYIDCGTFQFGPSVLEFIKMSEKEAFEALPYQLMEKFIAAKKGKSGEREIPLSQALPRPEQFAFNALKSRLTLLIALGENARFLKAEKGTTGDNNRSYLMKEISRLGGLQSFFSEDYFDDINKAKQTLKKLISDDVYTKSESPEDVFAFTSADKITMNRAASRFLTNLPFFIVPAEIMIYKAPVHFRVNSFENQVASIFASKAWTVLEFSMGETEFEMPDDFGEMKKVKVHNFFFPDSIRMNAAKILKQRNEDSIWGFRAKAELYRKFKNMIEEPFDPVHMKIEDLKVEELPPQLGQWVYTNRKILEALSSERDLEKI